MPSNLEFHVFPRLKSAKRQETNTDHHHDYKSGASFSGHLDGMKRIGLGTFLWPSGDRYVGEYTNNQRHGQGEQTWADRAWFMGCFVNDMRHGYGEHTWGDGESYKGDYFKDYRHGHGTYTWPDGSKFIGTFYKDSKEGYGMFVQANGNTFEGLYRDGERLGPGVLTYASGQQDVGVWHKERLVKLCSSTESTFTMHDHPEFDYDPAEHQIMINMDHNEDRLGLNPVISHRNGSGDATETDHAQIASQTVNRLSNTSISSMDFGMFLPSRQESVDLSTLEYDSHEYDQAFFKQNKDDGSSEVIALNNTPSSIDLQRHVYKHRDRQTDVSFSVDNILHGDRGNHSQDGPIEHASQQLISEAASGNQLTVQSLLMQGAVDVNVAAKCGHTALLGAAVNMHCDIINTLLDNGADVNKLNDEGLSALVACHLLFYPNKSFLYNIAERYLPCPENEAVYSLTLRPICPDRIGSSHSIGGVVDHQSDEDGDDFGEDEPYERTPSPTISGIDSEVDRIAGTMENDFQSDTTVVNYAIQVTEELVERSATAMSSNKRIVNSRGSRCSDANLDRARLRAIMMAEHAKMEATIRLLLKRGADPNASSVPMPAIFFAIKAADVPAVEALLEKGAASDIRLSTKKEGLVPLHMASAIRGEEGVTITRLLLEAGAQPNVRSLDNDLQLQNDWSGGSNSASPVKIRPGLDTSVYRLLQKIEEMGEHQGGRTPLHIACDRDDDNELARQVVHLLLENNANPNTLCCGQSPLSLAIASGNDMAIDELLAYGANPSLPLGHGIGSSLCVSANTCYEFRRTPQQRISLIDKLVKAGANILAPVPVGGKKVMGTAVDYAYWMFNQDRRIAHMPYHALTHSERDTYNARRKLLSHLGYILRDAAVTREHERLEMEELGGNRSVSPSLGFLYTGAGAKPTDGLVRPRPVRATSPESLDDISTGDGGKQVAFRPVTKDSTGIEQPLVDRDGDANVSETVVIAVDVTETGCTASDVKRLLQSKKLRYRKPLFKYCYECGRCLGVRLSACTRCKEVYYCSKACKIKAWNARHKEECVRVAGRGSGSRSPSPASKPSNDINNTTAATTSESPVTMATVANPMIQARPAQRSKGNDPVKAQGSKNQQMAIKLGSKNKQQVTTSAKDQGLKKCFGVKGQAGLLGRKGLVGSAGTKGKGSGGGSKANMTDEFDMKGDTTENYSYN